MSAAVRKSVRACERCSLRDSCKRPVPITGPTPSPYLIVGEAPGPQEDRRGRVFAGGSGALLRSALVDAGINLRRVAYCNVVACRTPGDRRPTMAEVEACRPNLRLQIAASRAQVVILCGVTALNAFKPKWQVEHERGRPWAEVGRGGVRRVFIPTHHPASVLRKQVLYPEFLEDLKQARFRVRQASKGESLVSGPWPEDCRVCHGEATWYTKDGVAYCTGHRQDDGVVRQGLLEGVV